MQRILQRLTPRWRRHCRGSAAPPGVGGSAGLTFCDGPWHARRTRRWRCDDPHKVRIWISGRCDMSFRLGVLTSGGDCAGLNAAIRAVVRRAQHGYGFEVIGIEDAGRGLMERRTVPLSIESLDVQGFDPMLSTGAGRSSAPSTAAGGCGGGDQAGYRHRPGRSGCHWWGRQHGHPAGERAHGWVEDGGYPQDHR